jgi:hypothetical protein
MSLRKVQKADFFEYCNATLKSRKKLVMFTAIIEASITFSSAVSALGAANNSFRRKWCARWTG